MGERVFLALCLVSASTLPGSSPPRSLEAQEVDVWSRPVQVERSRTVDFLHYRVTLAVDLDARAFRGENRITFTPFRDGVDRIELDAEELTILETIGPGGEKLAFEPTDSSIVVSLPSPLTYGDTVDVTVRYRGEDSREGFFFDDATDEHPRMVSTDSWPDEAHNWIPLYDYPNDKVTHELIVTVPEGNRVLSNGHLVGVTEDDAAGTSTWHWSQDRPHSTYLMMLAIGPFTVIQDSLGDLPVSYWVYPWDAEDARWIFQKTRRMIAFYSDLFDYPYPWAKYDQVTTPHVGGGAEATSATILGDGVIHDRRAEQDFSWERVIAHEISHQWWGDLITLREWSHTWLNESFGTYSDYLWTRHEKGEDEGAWDLLGKKNQYLREARDRYQRPIVFDRYERPQDNFDSHTYPKGAAILHQLRYLLGDEPFFRVLSTFLHEYAFEPVDTHDFMKTVKEVTGRNMDWFLQQSLYRPGHPVFQVSSKWDAEAREVRLTVAQVQRRDHGTPLYRTPLRIGIVTPSGRRVEEVWLSGREEETFGFPSSEEPLLVRFDEGNWLLKEWSYPKSTRELLYQAQNDDVIGREWAVRQLGRAADGEEVAGGGGPVTGGSAAAEGVAESAPLAPQMFGKQVVAKQVVANQAGAIQAAANQVVPTLTRIAREDSFWAVRVAALETLDSILETPIPDLDTLAPALDEIPPVELFKAAAGDENSRVRRTAIRLLGEIGDPTLLPFFRERFSADDSYQVQAEVLRAIGRTGDRSQLPFLREVSAMPSPQDVVREAAEWAMEEVAGRG